MSDFGNWNNLRTYNTFTGGAGWGFIGDREVALSGIVPGVTPNNSQWYYQTIYRQIGTLIDEIWRLQTLLAPVAGKYPVNGGEPSNVQYPSNISDDVITHWFGSQNGDNYPDPSLYPNAIVYKTVFENLAHIFDRLDAAGI